MSLPCALSCHVPVPCLHAVLPDAPVAESSPSDLPSLTIHMQPLSLVRRADAPERGKSVR